MQFFYLGSNRLGAELPSNWALPASLRVLDLRNNSFEGKVPSGWVLPELLELNLTLNDLTGRSMGAAPVLWNSTIWCNPNL